MIRLCLAAVTILLSAASASGKEIDPRSSFVGLHTMFGAASGGALGVALGGLHRAAGSDDSVPLIKWGLGGAAMGAVLGYEIGREEALLADRPTGTSYPALRGSSACLGAMLGQVAGLTASLIEEDSVDWGSRSVWARLALGTLLGASVGALLPPLAILPAPTELSQAERAQDLEMRRMEPLIPGEEPYRQARLSEEPSRIADSRLAPPPDPAKADQLNRRLAETEGRSLIGPGTLELGPAKRAEDAQYEPLPIESPQAINSVIYLALIEGAILGSCAIGSMGEEGDDLSARMAWGASLGALGGLSFGNSFARPWREPSARCFGGQETAVIGKRISGIFIGGAVGSFLGAAAGAVLRNSSESFSGLDATRLSLAGNLAGLAAGVFLTREPRP